MQRVLYLIASIRINAMCKLNEAMKQYVISSQDRNPIGVKASGPLDDDGIVCRMRPYEGKNLTGRAVWCHGHCGDHAAGHIVHGEEME